jgi:hypothetical protein
MAHADILARRGSLTAQTCHVCGHLGRMTSAVLVYGERDDRPVPVNERRWTFARVKPACHACARYHGWPWYDHVELWPNGLGFDVWTESGTYEYAITRPAPDADQRFAGWVCGIYRGARSEQVGIGEGRDPVTARQAAEWSIQP